MSESRAIPSRSQGAPWLAGPWWVQVALIALVACQWQHDLATRFPVVLSARAARSAGAGSETAAWIGAMAQLSLNALECLFYVTWWRGRGVRLPVFALYALLVFYSLTDLIAAGLAHWAWSHGRAALVVAPVAGFQALWTRAAGHEGIALAFGGVGLLTLLRLLGTIQAQVACGAPRARAVRLTLGAWLACRLLVWWSLDLARGASPVG